MTTHPARLVFAGSPEFAVPALKRLAASGHRIIAVLTQPDRPAGRGRHERASPVKRCAQSLGMTVLQPASLRREEHAREAIARNAPDLIVVVAYGLILPRAVLDIPRRGCINVHASLLPRWRGAAPIPAAILAGDAVTGVTIMRLEEELDTGPVAATQSVAIQPADTAGDLNERLAEAGARLLDLTLDSVLDSSAVFTPQTGRGVTYAPRLSKADGVLDWHEPAVMLDRRIRAYNPWPVAETRLDGRQLRCWLARPLAAADGAREPGTVIAAGSEGMDVQTGAGVLRLLSVQLAGRQRVPAAAFAHGHAAVGKVLGA